MFSGGFPFKFREGRGCSVHQGIVGRIFDYVLVVANGIGGGKHGIPIIASPLEFRRKVMGVIG